MYFKNVNKGYYTNIFFKMDLEKYILRIIEDTGLSRLEIQKMIREILKSRNGITSEEEAICTLIKDLCIKL